MYKKYPKLSLAQVITTRDKQLHSTPNEVPVFYYYRCYDWGWGWKGKDQGAANGEVKKWSLINDRQTRSQEQAGVRIPVNQ